MHPIIEVIQNNAQYAHWLIFGASLLAGMNIPISIDVLMITTATLAAVVIPASTLKLFLAIFLGCLLSSWITYWIGRKLGTKIIKWPFFSKIFSKKRLSNVKKFHEKRGTMALIIGRFIPFGVRNVLFMSNGMSKMSFSKFILWDGIACAIWSLVCFSLYYVLGKNADVLYTDLKIINFFIFFVFSMTVIGVIWYKKRKKKKHV